MFKVFILCLFVTATAIFGAAADLKGATNTDIDNYCAVFTPEIVENLKSIHRKWNPGWNRYRVTTFGHSNTETAHHFSPVRRGIFNISNASDIIAFNDSTFNRNNWLMDENFKGPVNGNLQATKIEWIDSICEGVLTRNKPMVAFIMQGVNNVMHALETADVHPDSTRPRHFEGRLIQGGLCNPCWPDTFVYRETLQKMINHGIIPIVQLIPQTNTSILSGWKKDRDWITAEYNAKVKKMCENWKIPYIDLYQWSLDHGGASLLYDACHSMPCQEGSFSMSDKCLQGGSYGGFHSARNYLLIMAYNDIIRYVIDGQTLTAGTGRTIRDPQKSFRISAAPNPFRTSVEIKVLAEGPDVDLTVEIYNAAGKIVFTGENMTGKGTGEFVWTAEEQPSGFYFLKCKSGNRTITKKILRLK
jgi:hypothetical protein